MTEERDIEAECHEDERCSDCGCLLIRTLYGDEYCPSCANGESVSEVVVSANGAA